MKTERSPDIIETLLPDAEGGKRMLRVAYRLAKEHYPGRLKNTTYRETVRICSELGHIYSGFFASLKVRSKADRSNLPLVRRTYEHLAIITDQLEKIPTEFWSYYRISANFKPKDIPSMLTDELIRAKNFCEQKSRKLKFKGRKEKDIQKHFIRRIGIIYSDWLDRVMSSPPNAPEQQSNTEPTSRVFIGCDLSNITTLAQILDPSISKTLVKSSLVQIRAKPKKIDEVS